MELAGQHVEPPVLVVQLTPEEMDLIKKTASECEGYKEAHNIRSKKFDPKHSEVALHEFRIKSEIAVARLLGVPANLSISKCGDNKIDFKSPRTGKTVSVRYRTKFGWDFALNDDKRSSFNTDFGIVVYPGEKDDEVIIGGVITKENFLKYCGPTDYGYGPRLAVELRHMDDIRSMIR